ncbi:MAG: hypothetical protein LQ337_003678 [Flavoplaca oasis]|nr:MAG: hypothetical protein LQ337_003678 [Flavoplaca oasis]
MAKGTKGRRIPQSESEDGGISDEPQVSTKPKKGRKGRKIPQSESEDGGTSDEPQVSTKPKKGRKKSTPQRTEAGPSERRLPVRQTSMPGAYPAESGHDEQAGPHRRRQAGKARSSSQDDEPDNPASRRPKKAKGVGMHDEETARPSPQSESTPEESYEEQIRKALALSLSQPALPKPSEEATEEEQIRKALALSLSQPALPKPSEEATEEEQMRWAMEEHEKYAKASTRPSSSADTDADYLRKLKESQDDHEALLARRAEEAEAIQKNEADLARVMRESQRDTGTPRHQNQQIDGVDGLEMALRLSMEMAAEEERRARSWTDNKPRAEERDHPDPSSTATQPAPLTEPAAEPSKPKETRPSATGTKKTKKKRSTLAAVPEDTVPTSSRSRPARTASSSGTGRESGNSQAIAIRQKDMPEATSQALDELQEPPIKIETLIAMCERAFPEDPGIKEAKEESEKSAAIHRAQHGDEDAQLQAAIARSQEAAEPEADISEKGVVEGTQAPSYWASERDKVVDHFRYTSSNYRNEEAGDLKEINKEIWDIMRKYQKFAAWAKAMDPKGKAKEGPLMITAPTPTDSSATNSSVAAAQDSQLDETSRPSLREDFSVPNDQEADHVISHIAPENRTTALRMQNQSRAIGQSRLPGSRPRTKPGSYMAPFGRLPIMVEENEQVAEASRGQMDRSTARKVRKNASYKRSGM